MWTGHTLIFTPAWDWTTAAGDEQPDQSASVCIFLKTEFFDCDRYNIVIVRKHPAANAPKNEYYTLYLLLFLFVLL